MSKFLADVASDLIEEHKDFEKHICVIPNKRMALFLKRELQKQFSEVGFLPIFMSPNDLIESVQDVKVLGGLDASIQLYLSFSKISEEPVAFKDFLSWGSQVLKDFNDIDLYQVDQKQLFSFISDARALEVWNVDGTEITAFQQRYLNFWKSLESLYYQFKEDLISEGHAYTGMAYETLNNKFHKLSEKFKGYSFSVIGFNALSKVERSIFKKIETEFHSKFYWDSDLFSLKDESMESALFLRGLVKEFKSFENPFDSRNQKKNIKVIPCAQTVLQGKYVAQELKNIDASENLETAVLLADESLLIPTLNAFDEEIDAPNISMGYSIKNTAIFSFVEVVLDLKIKQVKHKSKSIYFKDLQRLFEHEFGQKLIFHTSWNRLKTSLVKDNVVYCSSSWLEGFEIHTELKSLLSSDWGSQFSSRLISEFFISIKNVVAQSDWDKEQFFILINRLEVLNEYTAKHPFIDDIDVVKKIIRQLMSQEQIDLRGEPLSGVQLMGLLESRGLDFKNVFITSVNEDVFPKADKKDSFIPYDIKVQFGMPTWKERDAVYAYYFYRAIQRAENVYICYSEQGGETGAAEKSRFISQLNFEWEKSHPIENSLEFIQNESVIESAGESDRVILMSDQIKERLKTWMGRKVSPSALNTYLDCSMNFYYQYILGLGEIDEVEENISDSTFGSIIHAVLEDLFEPYINIPFKEESWDKMLVLYSSMLKKRYEESLKNASFENGKNYLSFKVALNYIRRFVKMQKEEWRQEYQDKLKVLGLEKTLESRISLRNGIEANIFGNIDRIDDINGNIRVVDYKSGNVDPKDVSAKNMEDLKDKPKAFQLMVYAWLYYRETGVVPLMAGNISFQNMKDFFIPVKIGGRAVLSEEVMLDFEVLLKDILSNMTSDESKFFHYEDSKKGKYCTYCI